MRYLPFRPLIDTSLVSPWWDEEDWPEAMRTARGLNIYEEDGKVFVQASVPGIPTDKIKVSYEDGMLRISAKNEETEETKKKGRVVHQWNKTASFDYAAVLPRPIDSKKIEAEVKDGVLTIQAPVSEEAKAKEIPVKSSK
jgi:HSP20 family protein